VSPTLGVGVGGGTVGDGGIVALGTGGGEVSLGETGFVAAGAQAAIRRIPKHPATKLNKDGFGGDFIFIPPAWDQSYGYTERIGESFTARPASGGALILLGTA
jgi:hypothetical protein